MTNTEILLYSVYMVAVGFFVIKTLREDRKHHFKGFDDIDLD